MKWSEIRARTSYVLQAATVCGLLIGGVSAPVPAIAWELEGFSEPYRTIDVSADETGTIQEILVREGEAVADGQPLARLNSDVHQAMLAIAEQQMRAVGRLDAALAELQMRRNRLAKLRPLLQEGHARQEEVDQAAAEVAVAEANVRTAQEDMLVKRLEYERIKTQIARRTIHAPVAGVVTMLHKDVGEYVSPSSPVILTLSQIDRLLANFTLTDAQAGRLRVNQEIDVKFPSERKAASVVEFISPVTDAESGTVLAKLRVENPEGRFRSGQRCRIYIKE